ncbi:general stress protein 26 [Deinococcus metalli]|uniref:General stress protein n=1 Tax=Deinococcus metalli TaxID=1141878 RepID=A0A7W8KHF6_9DEIO|nr:pyridoxamine 5'-phosphate oxidase family protein [Deinococcus metalli]MBB5377071.1 general stress protein 26 [Deinococcus metalli]GHF49187.1 general stress protein [Deinococcus metalli]
MSDLSHQDAVKKIAGIIKNVKFAMLTTTTAEGHLHARPMTTQETEFDGDVWFIGARDSEAVADMRARPQVNLAYAKPGDGEYVSVNGTAELVEDRAKLDELWSDFYKAYFEGGKEDPNIQLIKVHANGAEFWESDGKVRTLFQLAKGALTGQHAHMGQNDTVKL